MSRVRVVLSAAGMAALSRAVSERVVRPVTDQVAQDMRRYVPVLSGDLQGTVRTEVDGLEGRVHFGDVAGGVDYHLYQEYGTSRMSAQPYARPALFKRRSL